MTRQERNDLLLKCLSVKLTDVGIARAYDLANMAIDGVWPDETFDENECEAFVVYRLIVRNHQQHRRDSA